MTGESPRSAGYGEGGYDVTAFTSPSPPVPLNASPELLVAGTLALMLVGWWKIRTLEL